MSSSNEHTLKDPRKLYPIPEFEPQPQDLPGSEKAMAPAPDHGEASYRGAGRLSGLVALITGGDSGIGRAIALAYAREGADVAFTYLQEVEDAQQTENLIREAGQKVLSIKMDQSTGRRACEDAVALCVNEF